MSVKLTENEGFKKACYDFIENQTLCNWFKVFACKTWSRIGFTHSKKGLNIYETTLTQDFVFELINLFEELDTHKIQESIDETANGNDLEIFIQQEDWNYIYFPCQAKLLYRNNQYETFKHKVGGEYQIDRLIRHANQFGGYPIYLLYNYYKPFTDPYINKIIKNTYDLSIENFGCSITSAFFLRNTFINRGSTTKKPKFNDIHLDYAHPLYKLCDINFKEKVEGFLNPFNLNQDFSYEKFTKYSTYNLQSKNWMDIVSPSQRPGISGPVTESSFTEKEERFHNNDNYSDFNPKFRVIIDYYPPGLYLKS